MRQPVRFWCCQRWRSTNCRSESSSSESATRIAAIPPEEEYLPAIVTLSEILRTSPPTERWVLARLVRVASRVRSDSSSAELVALEALGSCAAHLSYSSLAECVDDNLAALLEIWLADTAHKHISSVLFYAVRCNTLFLRKYSYLFSLV
jgi:hypothetical protein